MSGEQVARDLVRVLAGTVNNLRADNSINAEAKKTLDLTAKFLLDEIQVALQAAPGWTTTKPDKPGWYWWRCFAITTGKQTMLEIVRIEADGYCRQEGEYVTNLGGEWSGPLVPPGEGT